MSSRCCPWNCPALAVSTRSLLTMWEVVQNRQAALRKRSRGSAAPLKNSNNYIQRLLLQEFAAGRERLLDLSCGPGRDLRKWIHCDRLQYVRAYSHSEEQVCKTDIFSRPSCVCSCRYLQPPGWLIWRHFAQTLVGSDTVLASSFSLLATVVKHEECIF